jgi:glycogen phosphorylase
MVAMTHDQFPHLANTKAGLQSSVLHHFRYSLGRDWQSQDRRDLCLAVSLAVRDRLVDLLLETEKRYQEADVKRLYYLSMEFLIGRSLGNNLHNLGIFETCREGLQELGFDLEELREEEWDAALGNGGLGRLAACFLDSLASLGMPGFGYGINYEYGLFKQEIDNGYQREKPDNWLAQWTPWQIERSDEACIVPVYGRIEHARDRSGGYNPMWLDWQVIIGVPLDMPIVGYGGRTVNYLRLYSARPSTEFDMQIFNEGDYFKAVAQKIASETVSKVLYPADTFEAGRELRLIQEYFLVACALRDIVRRYRKQHSDMNAFPEKVAIQLNDTHPALTVAELMRMLVDEHDLSWEQSWEITTRTLAYTNHTLLPEALEKWPVNLMETVLPRHLQIIYEINHRFLRQVAAICPNDEDRLKRMSLIEEGDPKQVRMAHLAIVGSHSTNGVAALHTELLKKTVIPDFYEVWPDRFNNKTNGVTQRRWLLKCNPSLAHLISATIGDAWITALGNLRELEPYAGEKAFQEDFLGIKLANKERLAAIIHETTRVTVNPHSLFDIQAKRMHEYKRQLLNVLHIIHEYFCLIEDQLEPPAPKTYIFAGKAAPGYWVAKQIIKLINNVGEVINSDPRVRDLIKVAFIPDYRVSLAEKIIPAADLSEQISTAGKEASGTGNMKFALNGALTIGTLDGANIEILEEVGEDNIFIFGLRAEEIQDMQSEGSYHPWAYYQESPAIRRVMDSLRDDCFCRREPGLFRWLFDKLIHHGDEYFHLADFHSYTEAHERATREYSNPGIWARKAILNVARIGKFSSDRTIMQYAEEIWGLQSIP